MPAPSTVPAVSAKNAALTNDVALDTKKLIVEDTELVKALAVNPSRVDAAILSGRRAAISSQLKNHE